jgi:hypothetical protein
MGGAFQVKHRNYTRMDKSQELKKKDGEQRGVLWFGYEVSSKKAHVLNAWYMHLVVLFWEVPETLGGGA